MSSRSAVMDFRRTFVAKAARRSLLVMQSLLPDGIYKSVYAQAFATYKAILRLLYFRQVIHYRLNGDRQKLVRAKTVYRVMPYSLVGTSGLEATFDAALDVIKKDIPGCFVECGVAQGGCSALMGLVAARPDHARTIWLFDSFQGLPAPGQADYDGANKSTGDHIRALDRGSCLGTKQEVEKLLFEHFGLHRASVLLVKGWFQDTLPTHSRQMGDISLLRIDADWYESTKDCLEYLYDRVVPQGYVIIDDYGTCFGCRKAVDEFLHKRGLQPQLVPDGRGGVLFVKAS